MRFSALILGVLATVALTTQTVQAQHRYNVRHYNSQGRPYYRGPFQLTLGAGTALYDGDLGNSPSNNFFSPAFSLGLRYRMSPHWHIGSELSYIKLGSRDQAKERGFAFTTTSGVGTATLRYDLIADKSVFAASLADAPIFQAYVQGGAGLILFDPKVYIGTERPTNNTVYLAPERNDYPAVSGVAQLGGGVSVRLTDLLTAGIEGNYYISTSDHLDGIQNRLGGASVNNDGFGTVMLRLDYSLADLSL
ncbi:MAG TPA: hypothetical protein VF629_11590 [Hymenobacter sp.]|jgi:hypothetical protein|uniref:hypothetical protein n=1 Tax=Hymenobacter sp. TaxID=1898978 RepID=UPI002ED942F5